MSPMRVRSLIQVGSFPRVSGDEPLVDKMAKSMHAFSPRERG